MSAVEVPSSRAPSRHRWLTNFAWRHPWLIGLGLLLTLTLSIRLIWGWQVGRQLALQSEEIRRRGEPAHVSELTFIPLADEENAWALYLKAGQLDDATSPANSTFDYADYPPFGVKWDQAARASEANNVKVFALARQARGLKRAQFQPAASTSPLFASSFKKSFSLGRQAANTVGDGALLRHLNGDEPEALGRLLDVFHLARAFHQDETLIGELVGWGINALGTQRAQVIAPGLRLDSAESRRLTKVLIDALLDEQMETEAFRRSLAFERLQMADLHRYQANGAWVLQPLAEQEVVRMNAAAATYAAAARTTNLVAARQVLLGLPPRREEDSSKRLARLFGGPTEEPRVPRYAKWYSIDDYSLSRIFDQWYRTLGDRRATAVSLAAQLYRSDHGGNWPARLDDLVPAYLPAIPADPFHADGRQLGYVVMKGALPDGKDRPLVYYDEGATVEGAIDVEPMYGWRGDPLYRQPRVEIRQYRDLARWFPAKRRFDVQERLNAATERVSEAQTLAESVSELELISGEQGPPQLTAALSMAAAALDKAAAQLAKAVDNDPDQPKAPGNDPDKGDDADE